jgi:hypothetical protein
VNALQEIFDSESFKRLKKELISRKIEERGYSLTSEQLAAIEEQIINASDDEFAI